MNSPRVWKNLNGIFPVLKPHGITSAQLLSRIKEKVTEDSETGNESPLKMGHGGTLDPTATGVMVVGVGNDCKNLKFFLRCEKSYVVKGQLGIATTTYNETGNVVMEKKYDHVTAEMIKERLRDFEGRIKQTPPLYSALKKHGRRYSDWANDGVEIDLKPRLVHCYELQLREFDPPYFTVMVSSGGGFYVRSLIHDLGQAIGSCAHVQELQRTKQGPFSTKDALSEDHWTPQHINRTIKKWESTLNGFFNDFDKW